MSDRPLHSTAETAALVGLAPRTLRSLVKDGCPSYRVGNGPKGQHRFDVAEVKAFLRQRAEDHHPK